MTQCNLKAIRRTIDVIGGKWKPIILWQLFERPYRFNDLLKSIEPISKKMLIEHLKQLETDGIVLRKDYNELPAKVIYSMTDYGKTLIPIFELLNKWGGRDLDNM